MAPTLPRLTSGAALSSSSSSSAGSKPDVIILSSDDEHEVSPSKWSPWAGSKPDVIALPSADEQEASGWKKSSSAAGSKPGVITLPSSDDDEHEASSWDWERSSSAGSKAGPVVLTSSDVDSDAELLANCRKRRPPRNVVWLFRDEVNILTALAAERFESGRVPGSGSALLDAIRRRVDLKRENPTASDVAKKVRSLMIKFRNVIDSGGPSGKLRDRKLYELSVKVWPELLRSTDNTSSSSSSSRHGACH